MSENAAMTYAEEMLARSPFLRNQCRDLEEFRDPGEPMPISMLGCFGTALAEDFASVPPAEWERLSDFIEEGMSARGDDVRTAVATGLIEDMVNTAERIEGAWPEIGISLGPLAGHFANAYRSSLGWSA